MGLAATAADGSPISERPFEYRMSIRYIEPMEVSDPGVQGLGPVLVANRGEISVRVQRSARELGLRTVAVFAAADRGAPHATLADESVLVASYLDSDELIRAARVSGARSVHPGYGFLAENADFARAVEEAGLIWIGPPPDAIEAMGSKVRAREMMQAASVPVLPGAELGPDADLAIEAERIGFDEKFLERPMNVDLSGGEKKRNETLQLGVLEPKIAILDEIDSGLDVDALVAVSRRVEDATNEQGLGVLAITHYKRLLEELEPDHVHVLVKGMIEMSGGPELADELEASGYAAFIPAQSVGLPSLKRSQPDPDADPFADLLA